MPLLQSLEPGANVTDAVQQLRTALATNVTRTFEVLDGVTAGNGLLQELINSTRLEAVSANNATLIAVADQLEELQVRFKPLPAMLMHPEPSLWTHSLTRMMKTLDVQCIQY